ncbi:MAG: hypothetical protein COV70_03885 [Parcubacteria group bacterium CG11_big_fil_rev_8_21_14_0_20_39_22]|nr:MAG: hypothetical protein COV70_03885 [Parcubacteria group bacterium CG11_big_fil_rev_8_21_14_0_20_39_22]
MNTKRFKIKSGKNDKFTRMSNLARVCNIFVRKDKNFFKLKPNSLQLKAGFSLIELIVATGLFVTVSVIAVGSLLSIVGANQKAQAMETVMNNLNFSLESMARNLRMGSRYHCGDTGNIQTERDCAQNGDDFVAFLSVSGANTIYALQDGSVVVSTNGGSTYFPLTSPAATIDHLLFYVDGTGSAAEQPRILITISGEVNERDRTRTRFNMQTLVSQRYREPSN